MKFLSLFKLALLSLLLPILYLGCSDSDEYLFDSASAVSISVSAKMAISLDSLNNPTKADTVSPEDTLIFIADVTPSKSVRMQKYFWTLDGEVLATEFSFRKNIDKPGFHQIALILVDSFGDTLTDSLSLWVSNPPILDTLTSIPENLSQEIPPQGPASFAWQGHDPDSIFDISYRFLLVSRTGDTLADNFTSENTFIYEDNLSPLECYSWNVVAFNQLGAQSRETLQKTFCTKGNEGKAAIEGFIKTSEYGIREFYPLDSLKISILDYNGKVIKRKYIQDYSNRLIPFRLSSIPEGNYLLTATPSGQNSDFQSDTLRIQLRPNQVLHIDSLLLTDRVKPSIHYLLDEKADTIDYRDTLKFILSDGGSASFIGERSKAYLDNKLIQNVSVQNDTLSLVLPEIASTWSHRLISITTQDFSENSTTRAFYIRPSVTWFETNDDMVIDNQEQIQLFIRDVNPFGFTPEFFIFNILTDSEEKPFKFDSEGDHEIIVTLPSQYFTDSLTSVTSEIRYSNGIVREKQWTIKKIEQEDEDE